MLEVVDKEVDETFDISVIDQIDLFKDLIGVKRKEVVFGDYHFFHYFNYDDFLRKSKFLLEGLN